MSKYVDITYRVKRNAQFQETMQKLTNNKIFNGYKDILMISAIIGYNLNRFAKIEKAASDGVLMQFFSQRDYDIIDLIAYSHKKEQSVISSNEKYEIFSSYANGGFPYLLKKLSINSNDEIDESAARKIIIQYYKLLLTNGFSTNLNELEQEIFLAGEIDEDDTISTSK